MENTALTWDILFVTGYKNAGKDLVAEIAAQLCTTLGIETTTLSTGDAGRQRIEKGDLFGKRLNAWHTSGKFYPDYVADYLALDKITNLLKEDKKLIYIGGPRTYAQALEIIKWHNDGLFGNIMCMEVIAPSDVRLVRAKKRTLLDKRSDLSKDGQPGVFDMKKYEDLEFAYGKERDMLVQSLIDAHMYLHVNNDGTKSELAAAVKTVLRI